MSSYASPAAGSGTRGEGMSPGPLARPLALAGKELKLFFRDHQALLFSLALPLVLVFLMVGTFGGQAAFHATAYFVNLDSGPAGAELARRLDALPEITVKVLEAQDAERRLAASDVVNVIVVGEGFSEDLAAGRTPPVTVRQRGTGGTEGQIVNSYAAAVIREMMGERQVARRVADVLAGAGLPAPPGEIETRVAALFNEARAHPPVHVVEEAVGARSEPVAIFLPGLVTMFTLFAISLGAAVLVEERKKGTLERLMATGLSRGELLAGTWLGTFGRGLFQVAFLFALAWAGFRIFTPATFGSVLAFGVVAVAAVSAVSLVIASLARTADQAIWIAVFTTMVMSVLGGSFFDSSALKGPAAVLARLTYNHWANDGLRRIITRGEPLASPGVLTDILVLGGIALVSAAVAAAVFRVRGDEK